MEAKCTLKDPDRTEHAYPFHLAGPKPQQFRSSCIRSVMFTTWRTITEDARVGWPDPSMLNASIGDP